MKKIFAIASFIPALTLTEIALAIDKMRARLKRAEISLYIHGIALLVTARRWFIKSSLRKVGIALFPQHTEEGKKISLGSDES